VDFCGLFCGRSRVVTTAAAANSGTSRDGLPPRPANEEVIMNRIRRLCRSLACLPRRACALAVFAATAPAAAAWPDPPPPPAQELLPGWNNYLRPGWNKHPPLPPIREKHPPLPAHAYTAATGGLPAWQITLIAAAAVLLAAALPVAIYRIRAARRRVTASTASATTPSATAHQN